MDAIVKRNKITKLSDVNAGEYFIIVLTEEKNYSGIYMRINAEPYLHNSVCSSRCLITKIANEWVYKETNNFKSSPMVGSVLELDNKTEIFVLRLENAMPTFVIKE